MSRTFVWELQMATMKKLKDTLREAGKRSGALAAASLYQEGLRIMAVSQRQVPVRWGVLRSTGTVFPPVRRGAAIEVVLAYGGPAAPYAWIQHEKLGLKHDEPTKAKYLEDPVLDAKRDFELALARRMSFLFNTYQVLNTQWPTEHWKGPAPMSRPRQRRSPRR